MAKLWEVPTDIKDVKELYAGYDVCMVIKNDGTMDGWGDFDRPRLV